jgi:hypothetical protein
MNLVTGVIVLTIDQLTTVTDTVIAPAAGAHTTEGAHGRTGAESGFSNTSLFDEVGLFNAVLSNAQLISFTHSDRVGRIRFDSCNARSNSPSPLPWTATVHKRRGPRQSLTRFLGGVLDGWRRRKFPGCAYGSLRPSGGPIVTPDVCAAHRPTATVEIDYNELTDAGLGLTRKPSFRFAERSAANQHQQSCSQRRKPYRVGNTIKRPFSCRLTPLHLPN